MSQTARDYCRMGRQENLTPEGQKKAREYYEQALAIGPDYMPAYAEYALVHVRAFQNGEGAASLKEARRLADKALELCKAPNSSWSQDSRALWNSAGVRWNEGDFGKAFEEFEAARKLAAKYEADIAADEAEAYIYYGDPNRAIELIEGAMARYPAFPWWYRWNLGRAYYMAERYQDAIDTIAEITDPPNDVRLITAASHARLGNTQKAGEIMAQFTAEDPNWSVKKSGDYPYGSEAAKKHWLDGLRMAGLKEE